MSWNYRVMKFPDCVGIVEAYYNKEGEINGWTDPIVVGENKTDLLGTLKMMTYAVDKADTKDGHEVLDNSEALEGGKPTDREAKMQKALEDATDCYVTVLCNSLQIEADEAYKFPEVKRWYALVDQYRSGEAKRRKRDVVS